MELENLPEGWEIRSLGEVAEIKAGDPAPQKEKYFENGNIPFVRMQDLGKYHRTTSLIRTTDKVNKQAIEECKLRIFPEGSVILPKSGSVYLNHRAILGINACVVSHIAILIPKTEVIGEFLYYILLTIDMSKWGHKTTGLDSLNLRSLGKIKIPLPPLEEQKKIVEILQFADYLKERRREAIKLIDKIVMSVFYDMFGDPATNPKGWEVKKLGDIVQDVRYGITRTVNKKEQGVPVLRVTDINNNGSINSNRILNADLTEEEIEKYRLKPGDILIARSGATAGKCGIYDGTPEIAAFASYIIKITLDKSIVLPKFLHTFLNLGEGKRELLSGKGGSAQPNINSKSIKSIIIPLPPLDLQQEFAEIVSKLEAKRKKMEEAEEKLEMLYQILLRQAFTGKLTEEWRMRRKEGLD